MEVWNDTMKAYVVTRNESLHEWEDYVPPRAGPIYVVNNGGVVNVGKATARVWNTGANV